MSLRAELVRLGLRWFVKRKIGPATTLEALRRQDAFLERLVPPPPKGTPAATRSSSMILCAWRSGCAPPDVRSCIDSNRSAASCGAAGLAYSLMITLKDGEIGCPSARRKKCPRVGY